MDFIKIINNNPDGDVGRCLALTGDRAQIFKRGRINIDFGDAGVGKTTFQFQKNICFALGQPFAGLIPIREIHCMYINTEQDHADLKRRYLEPFLRVYPANSDIFKRVRQNLEIYDCDEVCGSTSLNKGSRTKMIIEALEAKVDEFRSKRDLTDDTLMMLTIDPVYTWWADCLGTNANVTNYITKPLREFSKRKNIALTLVCHTHRVKKGELLSMNDIQGGHSLTGGVDSIFAFEKDEDTKQRIIRCLKGEAEGLCCSVKDNDDENKFMGDFEPSECPYDSSELRTLPETKSSDLYSILKGLFPWKVRSRNEASYLIRSLVLSKIISKVKGKNAYIGCQFGKKPEKTIDDIDQLNGMELIR